MSLKLRTLFAFFKSISTRKTRSKETARENFIHSVIEHCKCLDQGNNIPSQVEGLATHYASKIGDSCCFYHGIMALTLDASHLTREIVRDLGLNLAEHKADEKIMEQLDRIFAGLSEYHMSMIEVVHLLLIATFVVLYDVGKDVDTNCPPSGVCEQ